MACTAARARHLHGHQGMRRQATAMAKSPQTRQNTPGSVRTFPALLRPKCRSKGILGDAMRFFASPKNGCYRIFKVSVLSLG